MKIFDAVPQIHTEGSIKVDDGKRDSLLLTNILALLKKDFLIFKYNYFELK